MAEQLKIIEANRLDDSAIVVGFSDGTTDTFTADELNSLKVRRIETCEQQGMSGPSEGSGLTRAPLLKT